MLKWLGDLARGMLSGTQLVADDLNRLDAVRHGLGEQATDYVRTGEGGSVLSTLATLCTANELEVCNRYVQAESPTAARRAFLARAHPYPYDTIQRYVEVLTAAGALGLDNAPGTKVVPKQIRVLFGEAFLGLPTEANRWPRKALPLKGEGIVLEVALEMVGRFGGAEIDYLDVIYSQGGSKYDSSGGDLYRAVVDLAPLVAASPDVAIAAASRAPAAGRVDFIADLITWKLNRDARFTQFLVAQSGDGSKSVREAATAALSGVGADALEPLAIEVLGKGDVDQRTGMIELLGRLRTPSALTALRAHREKEKTARILAAIDTVLAISENTSLPSTAEDGVLGVASIDGRHIDVPSLRPLAGGDVPKFGAEDRAVLRAAIVAANEQATKQNAENVRRGWKYKMPMLPEGLADRSVDWLNGDARSPRKQDQELQRFLLWGPGRAWIGTALAKMPQATALRWAAALCGSAHNAVQPYGSDLVRGWIHAFLNGPDGDVRHLENLDIEAKTEIRYGPWQNATTRATQKGDLLRSALGSYAYLQVALAGHPPDAVWPYLAENLDVFDAALGVSAESVNRPDRVAAIRMLTLLPATPGRFFAPLLEAATGVTRAGRAEARALLGDQPEVGQRLISLLSDSRQAVRAGAAEWLADRKDEGAVPALWARLAKEKSELARAALLTALKKLGEDVSTVLGPDALIAEARKGLKAAKLDKLAWLSLDALPAMRFRNGAVAPAEVLRSWISTAYRLKQPGGNALFELYLDQLEPDDAVAISTWILDAWVSYDTAIPSELEANEYAKANAATRFKQMLRWVTDYTEERAFADLRREFLGQYLNSGADSKGLLALAVRAPSALAAGRVRAYLKNHGQRVSQAQALLELLIAIGDPVALQVVIAAATRLKQKGVQKFAGDLIEKVAEARDWTFEELGDRTIPSASFDDDGVLRLAYGEGGKEYEGRLTSELGVVLRNPAGKEVSSLPSADDDASKASKKQLSTTKKELRQILTMQTSRLYEALCAERRWASSDWLAHYHEHPVMRRLIERVVWLGLDEHGGVAGTFRPTAEGDFTNHADEPVEVAKYPAVRIAHGALLDDAVAKAWERHLEDYEVKPLFLQFGRTLLKVSAEQAGNTEIEDRKGWLADAFTIRGIATKLGYEHGPALDGGFFNEYRKPFASAGLAAVIEFTGNTLPEENRPAALISLKFERITRAGTFGRAAKLADVPPVLLSECWNDYRAMAAKGAYDANWERTAAW
jgi:hypothetical protein